MGAPIIREATARDVEAFYGWPHPRSMRAFVADLDGRPIAIAGLAYQPYGPPFLFSEMKPEMRRFPKAIVRGARTMLDAMKGVPAFAVASTKEPRAAKLLARLGFVHAGTCGQGEVYQWLR